MKIDKLAVVIRLMNPEPPKLSELKESIINMVIANERDQSTEFCSFEQNVVMSLVKAYVERAIDLADFNEKPELKLVSGAEAEKVWFEATEAGYRLAVGDNLKPEDTINPECLSWWPDYLAYDKGEYTYGLVRDIAATVGFMDGKTSIALSRMAIQFEEDRHDAGRSC